MNTYRIKLDCSIIPCFDVQVMKKFLFFKYWRTIKSFSFLTIEMGQALRNAEKFLKDIKNAEKKMRVVIR